VPYISVGQENSGSIDLYYEDHGSGRPVVLIHGWPLSSASWEKQVPDLLAAGYRVIQYDRRGFGNSSKPISGYDYDTFAKDLHQLMTSLDLRDAALVGFSMGGGEVARYLGTYGADRVRNAAFIDAIPPFLLKTPDNPRGVDRSVFDDIIAKIARDRYAFLSWFLANFYNVDVLGGKLVSDDVVRASWNVGAASSAKAFGDCVPAWLTDFRGDVARINVPTLVIHGDADRILPITATGIPLHESIKGSRLVVIQDGPHCTIWTHAEQVNAELVGFLGLRTATR
jgi:pimeloyl-ACP methyl ester carboxylesterase